ncbi:MAG: nucleotidyltransferase family protein [Candidatus Aminicenantes bacterium]|jgi:molybdenum cofactor cytidylyltransferase
MMKTNVHGIILAAGFSSRTGVFKMGLPWGEKKLIQRVIDEMKEICSRVIVVAGYKKERIIEFTKGYANVEVVFNPRYRSGMFTSVKEGVKHVKSPWFFLTPGDFPLITKAIYQRLLDARDESGQFVFIPVFNGRKGHPILVKSDLVKELLEEPDDSNLRKFIKRKGFTPVQVDDDSILVDIDTIEDYQRAKERHSPQSSQSPQRNREG